MPQDQDKTSLGDCYQDHKRNNMAKTDTTQVVATAAANASAAASSAAQAANTAANNAQIAAKAAADSATAIAVVATDTSWMKKSLSGIEEKLNEMDKAFVTAAQHREVTDIQEDHEKRIRTLETRTILWLGGLALLGPIVTILIGVATKFIK